MQRYTVSAAVGTSNRRLYEGLRGASPASLFRCLRRREPRSNGWPLFREEFLRRVALKRWFGSLKEFWDA
jgi:hypothetical protein